MKPRARAPQHAEHGRIWLDAGPLINKSAEVKRASRAAFYCARAGKQCVEGAGTGVFCASSAGCERDHCKGNTAVRCREGRADIEQDCAELVAGGRCYGNGESFSEVRHPDCPSGVPFVSFCEGDAARACYVGALYEVACDEFQGGHCTPRERGDGVRCRVPGWP